MLRLETAWADLNQRGSDSVRKTQFLSLIYCSVTRHSEGVDNIAFLEFERNLVKGEQ